MNFKEFKKIDDEKLMTIQSFEQIPIGEVECEDLIFEMYPDYKFVIITRKGSCFVYAIDGRRTKFENIQQLFDNIGNVEDKSIINTDLGQSIKDEYEKISGIKVKDILKIPYIEGKSFLKKRKEQQEHRYRYGPMNLDIEPSQEEDFDEDDEY